MNAKVVNVVASTSINKEIDLNAVHEDLDSTKYNPEDFPGLVYEDDISSLVFNTGKIVTTGGNTIQETKDGAEAVIEAMRGIGIEINDDDYEVKVENIVSDSDFEQDLNLHAIAIAFGFENVEYEPEQFPGLIYRLDEPDVCVLLFSTGKAVVTGGNEIGDAEDALDKVNERLDDFQLL